MNTTLDESSALPTSVAVEDVLNETKSATPPSATSAASFGQRLRAAWKRRQYLQIQRAIRNYSTEKHFLSPMFRPVVGPATMRMAYGQIERNKLPLNADPSRPWLRAGSRSKGPMMLASTNSIPPRTRICEKER